MGIFSIFKGKGNVLYYPGCLTKYVLKDQLENYKRILEKLGIDYIMLPDELCCGSPVWNAGYETDARKLARKNLETFKKHKITKIITACPACFVMLSRYKELLPDWNIKVEHIVDTINDILIERQHLIVNRANKIATYHDPCHLGRHAGIYEQPRELLKMLGYEIIEMKYTKQDALCCGGGAGLKANNPELADKIAKFRLKQASDIRADTIITTCPLCFSHLLDNSFGIEIIELSDAVADALNLKIMPAIIREAEEAKEKSGEAGEKSESYEEEKTEQEIEENPEEKNEP